MYMYNIFYILYRDVTFSWILVPSQIYTGLRRVEETKLLENHFVFLVVNSLISFDQQLRTTH